MSAEARIVSLASTGPDGMVAEVQVSVPGDRLADSLMSLRPRGSPPGAGRHRADHSRGAPYGR